MSVKPDGGNAFPTDLDAIVNEREGMSLRDWFAGMALSGVVPECSGDGWEERLAESVYKIADKMIEERDQDAV